MDRNGGQFAETRNSGSEIEEDKSRPMMQFDQGPMRSSNFFLDRVGEVVLTLNSNGLSWKLVGAVKNELDASSCLGIKFGSKFETEIKFSDVYAIEFIDWGLIHDSILPNARVYFLDRNTEMYRFVVHGYQKSKTRHSLWILASYTFGHKDLQTCQSWVEHINAAVNMEVGRPKSLLVFVHPFSGKGNGSKNWETVAPIFSRAKVRTKVIVTQRAGHAFDVMASITDRELNSYDGVLAVGGDGFFNEILNGLLSARHQAPYPPVPTDFMHSVGDRFSSGGSSSSSKDRAPVCDPKIDSTETAHQNEDCDPLLSSSEFTKSALPSLSTKAVPCNTDQDPIFPLPNKWFRLGIIPAGSTDAIVICTTGTRDPVTSALHIVLGKRVRLDIAQVVRWKTSASSTDAPSVSYAASFAGYGFYGDVIRESENYRWMGPKRYDYAGTKVFLRHRSYEAEIVFKEVKTLNSINEKGLPESETHPLRSSPKKPKKEICRRNCVVCSETVEPAPMLTNGTTTTSYPHTEESTWLRSKGRFLSVGAAIISCRNEKAPDGLVADAHLADGFLHLVLIKDCPRAFYLWHLTQLTRKGSNPLNFEFVEHHKTQAFTFISSGNEGVWNLDGELFQAHQLSAQVFRGLISLFAAGPEV